MNVFQRNLKLILFLVFAAGAFAALYEIHANKNTVVLRDDGFYPRTLTIHAGETVTFRSERGKYFWPASDPHPSHSDFPAFDAKKAIAPNDSWSFTFTTPGLYKYHNHLEAFYFGLIRVIDQNGTVPQTCIGGQLECWENEIYNALADKGLGAAYDTVAKLYATEPDFAKQCHSVAHTIGLETYQFYKENPNAIFSPKAVACAAGFYHGFMEGFLGATGDIKGAAAVCDKIGATIGKESPDARLQCFHGIGHGAIETAVASTGIFGTLDEMTKGAIAICEQATAGVEGRYRCVSGIYNAIANLFISNQYKLSVATENPLALCSRQNDAYKEACYGNMNSLALWLYKNDFSKAARYMLTIPDEQYRAKAIVYLANLSAVDHVKDTSFGSVVAECDALPSGYRLYCITGFAQGLLEHGSPGKEYEKALLYCNDSGMDAPEHAACFRNVLGNLHGWYSEEKSAHICASLSPGLQQYCKK